MEIEMKKENEIFQQGHTWAELTMFVCELEIIND